MAFALVNRDILCFDEKGPKFCPDAPDEGDQNYGSPCDHCRIPLFEDSMETPVGMSIQRAVTLRAALDMGVTITLGDIRADEFSALRAIQREVSKREAQSRQNG